jgi:hypothetical protein
MKKTALALTLLLIPSLPAEAQDPVATLMKAKAGYAHRLLDAVVLGQLDTVRDQAFRLKAVAETEDWNVMKTPDYVRESETFIRTADRLLQSTASRSPEAVALAYVELTLSCVRCHQYVNDLR